MATIEIRIAPLTLRTHSAITQQQAERRRPRTGQPCRLPSVPSWTGTVVLAASGMRRTKPASTKPMSAMNRPMPTEIATLSCGRDGVEDRRPEAGEHQHQDDQALDARPGPSRRPRSSGVAIANATNAFRPSPVASASG